ncbi:guanine nucleotide binding protein, alpha subunit [Mycena capillaripes]|nr:guanine nucleotide binding protein, alpha subunit [Mycena capillaripes]
MIPVFGGRGAGVSTFMRQVKLFSSGYDAKEREEVSATIKAGVMEKLRNLIFDNPDIQAALSSLSEASAGAQALTPELSTMILNLWTSPEIKEVLRASPRFQEDSSFLEYILDSITRIVSPEYIPTEFDIVICNLSPPSPITEIPFIYSFRDDPITTTLVHVRPDTGLQRKWIQLLGYAEAMIFLVDLTCYDQIVYSADTDEQLNCMRDAMRHFESVHNSRFLDVQLTMLVMNKFDLFTEKLKRVPFTECFLEYTGPNEPRAAATYCIKRFTHLSARASDIRGWCTNALDTDQMRVSLREMMETIFLNRVYII